jgi:hypothetical protein
MQIELSPTDLKTIQKKYQLSEGNSKQTNPSTQLTDQNVPQPQKTFLSRRWLRRWTDTNKTPCSINCTECLQRSLLSFEGEGKMLLATTSIKYTGNI